MALGGDIRVQSTEGIGSVFTLVLPYKSQQEQQPTGNILKIADLHSRIDVRANDSLFSIHMEESDRILLEQNRETDRNSENENFSYFEDKPFSRYLVVDETHNLKDLDDGKRQALKKE